MRGIHSSGHNLSRSFGNRAFEMVFLVNVTMQNGKNTLFFELYNENIYTINPRVQIPYKIHKILKFHSRLCVALWQRELSNFSTASFKEKKTDPHKMFSNTYRICHMPSFVTHPFRA
jgi:hypothetical protein